MMAAASFWAPANWGCISSVTHRAVACRMGPGTVVEPAV